MKISWEKGKSIPIVPFGGFEYRRKKLGWKSDG
jgi:hypothetical protein